MCVACDALQTEVPLVEAHAALLSVGVPFRTSAHAWVIDFRCTDCRTQWHFVLDPDDRRAGFRLGAIGT